MVADRNSLILYLHPAVQDREIQISIPVGVIPIADSLRKWGFRVLGLNLQYEQTREGHCDVRRLCGGVQPMMILIDLHWYQFAYASIELSRQIKETWPDVPVILGGLTASAFAEEILERFKSVDFVLVGEAEEGSVRLASKLRAGGSDFSSIPNLCWRTDGYPVRNTHRAAPADLDAGEMVDMGFLYHHEHLSRNLQRMHLRQDDQGCRGFWLSNARGCAFDCDYCGGNRKWLGSILGRRNLCHRSAETTQSDLTRLRDDGINVVGFTHDVSVFPPSYWQTILETIREYDLGMVNHHFQIPDGDFVNSFAESANLDRSLLGVAVLTADEDVRRGNGKTFSNERLTSFVAECRRRRIPLALFFSCNLPGASQENLEGTLRLAKEIARLYPPGLLHIGMSLTCLEPGSALSRGLSRYPVEVVWHGFMDYYERFSPGFSRKVRSIGKDCVVGAVTGFENHEIDMSTVIRYIRQFGAMESVGITAHDIWARRSG